MCIVLFLLSFCSFLDFLPCSSLSVVLSFLLAHLKRPFQVQHRDVGEFTRDNKDLCERGDFTAESPKGVCMYVCVCARARGHPVYID